MFGVVFDLSIGYLPRKVYAPTCMGSERGNLTMKGVFRWVGGGGWKAGMHELQSR